MCAYTAGLAMTDEGARAILTGPKSYASMRELEPSGIALTVTAQKTNFLPLAIILSIIGPVGVAVSIWLIAKPPASIAQGLMPGAPIRILVGSCLISAMGPMLLLIRLVTGPERNGEFQAIAGRITADRYIAGDRVRSIYTAGEVRCLFMESNVLCIETRKGNSQLIAYGTVPVNEAIGYLLARSFWPDDHVLVTHTPRSMFSHRLEKTVFHPDQTHCGEGIDAEADSNV